MVWDRKTWGKNNQVGVVNILMSQPVTPHNKSLIEQRLIVNMQYIPPHTHTHPHTHRKHGTNNILDTMQVFGILVKSTLSAYNLISKSSSYYSHYYEIRPFVVCKTISSFSGSMMLRNLPLSFPIPVVKDMTENASVLWAKVLKSVINYLQVIENI